MTKATADYDVTIGAAKLPAMPSSPYARLKSDWRTVLTREMSKRGFSKRGLSLRAGLGASIVSEWFNEKKLKEPSFASLALVANALGVSIAEFVEELGPPSGAANDSAKSALANEKALAPATIGRANLLGTVAAGVWQEPRVLALDEDVAIPCVPEPEYANLRQFAWRVCGNSLNRIAKHGTYVIGVSVTDTRRGPRDNDLVVCERRKGDVCEYTVKRYRVQGDRVRLDPESDDPRFQQPVWLSDGEQDGAELVQATHLVIGAYTPLL